MTIALSNKRQLFWLLALFICNGSMLAPPAVDCEKASEEQVLESLEVLEQPNGELNKDQFSGVTKKLGEHLKETMIDEMNKLIDEMDSIEPAGGSKQKRARPKSTRGLEKDDDELERLRQANKRASEDVEALVGLTGDNTGALPQAGLNGMMGSFGDRLQTASNFVGNKINSMSNSLKRRIPERLKKFFIWPNFLSFKLRFNKVYKTLAEELYRQMVFLTSQVRVGMQHLRFKMGLVKYLTGQNQFSDVTSKEFYGFVHNPETEAEEKELKMVDDETVAKLEQLASQRKEVHGFKMSPGVFGGGGKARKKRQASGRPVKRRLVRRSAADYDEDVEMFDAETGEEEAEDMDVDEDVKELNELDVEEEYDEDEEDDFFESELQFTDVSNELVDDNDFKSFEQFVDESSLNAMINLDEELDKVLNDDKKIHPFDLRQNNCFPDSDNQGNCGACYAFAMNHMASYYRCMETRDEHIEADEAFKSKYGAELSLQFMNRMIKYSPRFISDCGIYLPPQGMINGCIGGRAGAAFDFIQDIGQMPAFDYDVAKAGLDTKKGDKKVSLNELGCPYPAPKNVSLKARKIYEHGWNAPKLAKVKSFAKAEYNMIKFEHVETFLQTNGPVIVNVRIWEDFKEYRVGIVNNKRIPDITGLHSMLIVGVDLDAEQRPYYIILNSHGVGWGDHGYVKIDREMLRDVANSYAVVSPKLID